VGGRKSNSLSLSKGAGAGKGSGQSNPDAARHLLEHVQLTLQHTKAHLKWRKCQSNSLEVSKGAGAGKG
jgi:hypothetical protein